MSGPTVVDSTVRATLNSTGDLPGEQRIANVKLATGLHSVDVTMVFSQCRYKETNLSLSSYPHFPYFPSLTLSFLFFFALSAKMSEYNLSCRLMFASHHVLLVCICFFLSHRMIFISFKIVTSGSSCTNLISSVPTHFRWVWIFIFSVFTSDMLVPGFFLAASFCGWSSSSEVLRSLSIFCTPQSPI